MQQEEPDVSVCIEGIEDIDVVNEDETRAIQCKYYAKTEYNHSVIKSAIMQMVRHFAEHRNGEIKYHFYGHYKSGQEKLSGLSCKTLKSDFLTYKKIEKDGNGEKHQVTYLLHEELSLNDSDLEGFLGLLAIDVNAPSLEEQYQAIVDEIESSLGVSRSEAELYHYNSALKVVRDLSVRQAREDRYISKSEFIKRISARDEVFDTWFIRRKGRDKYLRYVKREYMSSGLNMEPFERFFLIDCKPDEEMSSLKEVVLLIARKWSKVSSRQKTCYCPAVYFNGLKYEDLIRLKNSMYSDGWVFLDPYPFKGACFSYQHFYTEPSVVNKIKFRFVDSLDDLHALVEKAPTTVEVYQFYLSDPYFVCDEVKHAKIRVEDIGYIKELNR